MTGYRNGDRHGWLANLCGLLERIGQGKAAEDLAKQILAMPAAEFGRRSIVSLPMWAWAVPGKAAGRKGVALDGGQLLLPLRVMWDAPLVVAVPRHEPVDIKWRTYGYGRGARGTTTVVSAIKSSLAPASPVQSSPAQTSPVQSGRPARLSGAPAAEMTGSPMSRRAALSHLRTISEDGRAAWWEATLLLEPWLQKSLYRAHAKISHEFTGLPETNGRTMILSDTTIEAIADHMLLGNDSAQGTVARMLDACLRHDFAKVDPMRYIKTWLRRDAEEAIRRDLDDPKLGPKVRRLAEASGARTNDELLDAYRAAYPSDEVGIGRLTRALSVCADPMAERRSLDHDESLHSNHWQEAS